jgi:hypothetical protein
VRFMAVVSDISVPFLRGLLPDAAGRLTVWRRGHRTRFAFSNYPKPLSRK